MIDLGRVTRKWKDLHTFKLEVWEAGSLLKGMGTLGYISRSGIDGSDNNFELNFWGTVKLYTAVVPFYIPIRNVWGFQFCHLFAKTHCLSFWLLWEEALFATPKYVFGDIDYFKPIIFMKQKTQEETLTFSQLLIRIEIEDLLQKGGHHHR